ncbi:MAG: hypothetical protein KJ915_10190 [Candidatus Omnitrophica bacterium]|nr:hypothetical protein [Candidatus Omnitrophota bacterium]
MTDKNDSNQKKNDFLEAKMYYYNTDPLTERDKMLNSKSASNLQSDPQKQSVLEIKNPRINKSAIKAGKSKSANKKRQSVKKPSQKKVLECLAGLEDRFKQLVHILNISKVSVEIESIQKSSEKFEDQISELEQERLTLLEQITSLEAQIAFSAELEAEKNELKDQVSVLITEKNILETSITQLRKEIMDNEAKASIPENEESIVYLSKEREALENKIALVLQEKHELHQQLQQLITDNDQLTKKISDLDEKVKAVAYLDKKSAMLEDDIKDLEKKNQSLSSRISDFAEKNGQLTKQNIDLLASQQLVTKQIDAQKNWQEEIDFLGSEVNNLKEKNKQLNLENQELMKTIIAKEKNEKIDLQKQRLLERIDELEQERLHLFKIIGDMEEASKESPELIAKNDLLYRENEELKTESSSVKKQIAEFLKNTKNMQAEIIQLKEKRACRLELEQEKGKMQKRIKDLEEQCSKLANTIKNLNTHMAESNNSSIGLEHLRKEITALETEKAELIIQAKNDQEKIQQLKETISIEKGSENAIEVKITDLNNENKILSEKIKTMQITQPVNYVLDLEKLSELKDFVLESIQTRRWKSTEFVNGAYDAVGLFYRTVLQERLIKINK